MSQFIVPLSNLPTISSIEEKGKTGIKTQNNDGSGVPFADFLHDAMKDITTTSEKAQSGMYNLATGATDDLHTGAINTMKYTTAVSFATGVASSVIRAYNELTKMQI